MKTSSIFTKLMALFLAISVIVGLCPSVAIFDAMAEDRDDRNTRAISDDINQLLTALGGEYGNLKIPQTKAKYVNSSTINNLDGTYFMFIMAKNGHHVMINYGAGVNSRYDRLSENCYSNNTTANGETYAYYPSIWINVGNWGTGNDVFTGINDLTVDNLLDYAVEIQKYTGSITYNTTEAYNESTSTAYSSGTGWEDYNRWEFYRSNGASVGYANWGTYFGISQPASKSDPVYSIKSLHPSKANAPYIGTSTDASWLAYLSTAQPFFFVQNVASGNKTFKTYKINQKRVFSYWLGVDSYYSDVPINLHTLSQIIREDKNQNTTDYKGNNDNKHATDWELIQISPYTLELYKALYKAKSYVSEAASKLYPAETYLGFLKFLQTAMAEYKENYTVYEESVNERRTYFDSKAKDLLSYMALLDIEKNPDSYTDITMEILDFRADGLLFEGFNDGSTAYSLAVNSASFGNTVRPGTAPKGDNGVYYVEGLIEPDLVNGQIVYKPETIAYIATALNRQHQTFADSSISNFNATRFDAKWNSVFMNMVSKSGNPLRLGSWEETKLDIDTKDNGGILPFFEVDSCYDLAYYMLTNIWRQTDTDDIVDQINNQPYNTKVSELHTMRLLRDNNGQWVFNSKLQNGRNLDAGLIYNYPSFTDDSSMHPNLNAISDLGFEGPSPMYGNNSTGVQDGGSTLYGRRNYHVMYHMQSTFVYYEAKDLKFSFEGDDDVYFFINGHLVCDLGGMHSATTKTKSLNGAIAKDLGLKDGNICTFDMFLVDRHTTGINLNLSTNIEMTPAHVATEKSQYYYSKPGLPETEIREGASVADMTDVGYGFKLLNNRGYGVKQISFTDKNLGVTLSESTIALNGYANVEDLTLVYRSYDPIKKQFSTAQAENTAYILMNDYLQEAIGNMSTIIPLEDKVYTVTGLTQEQLKKLLEIGLPANMQLEIYGFHRTVSVSGGTYSNTVSSSCTPIIGKENDVVLYGDPLLGSATRNLTVLNLDSVSADRFPVVLDYGKPIDFSAADIIAHLDRNASIASASFRGIRLDGIHGSTGLKAPSYLYLEKDGDTLETENGYYVRSGNTIRFTAKGLLEGVDEIFAIVAVADASIGTWYLTVAIDVLPANIMYYEAESLAEKMIVDTLKKDETGSVTWSEPVSDDALDPDGEGQDLFLTDGKPDDMVIDREFIPDNAFFVDFDGRGYAERYRLQPQYSGIDFDNKANWSVYTDSMNIQVNTTTGTLSFEDAMVMNSSGEAVDWNYIHTGTSASAMVLNYAPGPDDYMQIRMKLENGSAVNEKFTVSLEFNENGILKYLGSVSFLAEEYLDGNYHIFNVPLTHAEYEGTLKHIRPIVHGIQNCKITIDYIYVGPTAGLPNKLYADYLFFGFDDTNSSARRYQGNSYGGYNFDKPGSWDVPSDASGLQIANGTAIIQDDNRDPAVRWDYMETKGANNMPLSYKITGNDVLQVRLMIVGGAETPGFIPQVRMEFMTSEGLKHAGNVLFSYNVSRPDITTVYSGQYYTFTIPLNDAEYLSRSTLQSIRFVIYNIEGTDSSGRYETHTIDYIYLGPASLVSEINKSHDYLFFDFKDNNAEALRYSDPIYGNSTYDFRKISNWAVDSTTQITGLDGNAGTITFKDIHTGNYNFIQPGPNNGSWTLNYKPKANDVMQVRMKITQGSTSNSYINVRAECNKGNGVLVYGEERFDASYLDGEYHIFTVPLNHDAYKNLIASNGVFDGFRFVLIDVQNVTYTVDYIYFGPLAPSNPASRSLYFGFENSDSDAERYNTSTYGNINFDRWNASSNSKANWATAYGMSSTEDNLGGSGTDFAINNRAGTLTVYPSKTVSADDNEIYRVDVQPTAYYGSYQYSTGTGMPLKFRPDSSDVIRIRLKVENVSDGSEEDLFINDDGWNEAQGDALDPPRVEIRVNYYKNGERKSISPNTYTATIDTSYTDYQVLTIPLEEYLKSADYIQSITLRFFHIKNDGNGKIVIDYIYMGPGDTEDYPVYGYDTTYGDDEKLSDGKSLYVEGNGVKLNDSTQKYTEATFSFTGTGFDLISRTGKEQATIRVAIYDDPSKTEDHLVKSMTVNNKGELELFQIPIVSVQGLEHGTYYVTLWVNDAVTPPQIPGVDLSSLARGNQFYFDAIRIYDPIDVSGDSLNKIQALALSAYKGHKEAYQFIKEIRNILLGKEIFDDLNGTVDGAVYIDINSSSVLPGSTATPDPSTDRTTDSIQTYNKLGPKNEVYLAPGQAVAFRLAVDTMQPIASLDIGAKTITAGSSGQLAVGYVVNGEDVEGLKYFPITSASARYYPMDTIYIRSLTANSSKEVYLVLLNNSEGGANENVISLTDVKVAYQARPTVQPPADSPNDEEIHKRATSQDEPIRFLVDRNATKAVESFVNALWDTPIEDDPTENQPIADGIRILHSLSLASNICINYVVYKEELQDYENITLTCKLPLYEGDNYVGSTSVSLSPVDQGMYYSFTLSQLAAVNLNDTVEAILTLEKDGQSYVSATDSYSIARYAYNQLNNSSAPQSLKALCAELLRYGSATQIYKGYRTGFLADAGMTEEFKSYLSDTEVLSFGNENRILNDLSSPLITWAGKTLTLDSKISIKFVMDASQFQGDPKDLSLRITYTDGLGEALSVTLRDPQVYNEERKQYSFTFDGLLASELRKVLKVAVYDGNTRVSATMEYSPAAYGANKTGELLTLCKALLAYSDSAQAYFG